MKKGLIFAAFCVFGFNDLNCVEAMSPSNSQACATANNHDELNKRLEILRQNKYTKPFESTERYKEMNLGANERLSTIFGYYEWNGIKVIDVSYETLFNYVCNNHSDLQNKIAKIMNSDNVAFNEFLIGNKVLLIEEDSNEKHIEKALENLIESKSGRKLLGKFIILKKLQEKNDNIVGFFKTIRLKTTTRGSACHGGDAIIELNPSNVNKDKIIIERTKSEEAKENSACDSDLAATLMHELVHQFHYFIGLDACVRSLEWSGIYAYDGSLIHNFLYSLLSNHSIAEKFNPFLNEEFCTKFASEVNKLIDQNKIEKKVPEFFGGLLVIDCSEVLNELKYRHLQLFKDTSLAEKIARFYCNVFLVFWDTHEEALTISGIGPYWFREQGTVLPLLIVDEQSENSYLYERFSRYRLLHVCGTCTCDFSRGGRDIAQNLINEFGLFLDPIEIKQGDNVTYVSSKVGVEQTEDLWGYLDYVLTNKQVDRQNVFGVYNLMQRFMKDKAKKKHILEQLGNFQEFLKVAIEADCIDIVKYLIEECHCNQESKDKDGVTPLHIASKNGHLSIVKYLIEECHCDIETKDKYNKTPLIWASKEGHLDIVEYLTQEGKANVDSQDEGGQTPLHIASENGHLDIVKYLFETCHCKGESKDKDGRTPLHLASKKGRLDIVRYLIEKCYCNVEAKDNDGRTPLHLASKKWRLDIVRYLVETCHCNVEAKDNDGRTPLHLASKKWRVSTVQYLVEKCHCNVGAKDNDGETPLDVAISDEIKEYLRQKSHPMRYFIKQHPVATKAVASLTLMSALAWGLHFIGIF